MKTLILVIFAAFLSVSCSDFLDQEHSYTDPELIYYVNKFKKEASNRNVNIETSNLIVILGNSVKEDGVIGITKYSSITKVIIDREFFQSRQFTDTLMLETVIFHEFGHAIMHREHCDTYSLMNPNKFIQDYRQNADKRKLLIDELLEF